MQLDSQRVAWRGRSRPRCTLRYRGLRARVPEPHEIAAHLLERWFWILGQNYLAIVNPAAGGGRSRKLLGPALERLRAGGVEITVAETTSPGEATEIARQAYGRGVRNFIAVGGDGTSYEIVNG
jgi:hypothetical protein